MCPRNFDHPGPPAEPLIDLDAEPAPEQVSKCASGVVVMLSRASGAVAIVPTFCHRWDCPHCSQGKYLEKRAQAFAGRPERLLTLTLRARPQIPLESQVRFIRDSFRKLVQAIRRTYDHFEYMAVLELTKAGTPHLHCLTRGTYIPQRWLSERWQRYTGAHRVDIRKIDQTPGAVGEVLKYTVKTARKVQQELPGVPICTMSRGWLPEDFNDDSDPADPYESRLFLQLSWSKARRMVEEAGGTLTKAQRFGSRYEVNLPRAPDPEDLEWLLDGFSWRENLFGQVLVYAADPTLRQKASLEDWLDLCWDRTSNADQFEVCPVTVFHRAKGE